MKEIFETIIKNRYWQDAVCGTGSTLKFTEPLRQNLKGFLEQHKLTSMLDAPCGDYSWMSVTELPQNFKYIGADIVQDLVTANQVNYPNVEFHQLDICQDLLPDVDVLFCRDCLIHFSFQDINRALANIVRSNIKYIMLTNYPDYEVTDIETGNFHKTNFTTDPVNLGLPIDSIFDWVPNTANKDQKRHMSIWHRSAVENYLQTL
jgi:SAM-dependent methyltransferase